MSNQENELVKFMEQYIFSAHLSKPDSGLPDKDRSHNAELATKAWGNAKAVAQQLGIDLGDRLNDHVNRIWREATARAYDELVSCGLWERPGSSRRDRLASRIGGC